ncbi:MAG TPA: cytochrome P450 [Rhodothermales bacterium]|nr:cytochrome P450 [Rhodothermales bacterium]
MQTPVSTLPGPRPAPVLGVYGNFIAFLRKPLAYMHHLHQTYGDMVTLAEGTTDYIFAFSPAYNELLLNDTTHFYNLDASSMPIQVPEESALARLFTGLIQMNGERHKQQRRLMLPAFHRQRVASYRDDIVRLTEQMLTTWEVGQPRDLYQDMRKLTLAVAVKTLLGLDPAREGEGVQRLLEQWINRVFSIPALLFPIPMPGLPYYRLLRLSEQLVAEIRSLIRRKRAGSDDQGDVLTMLMQAHDEDGTRLTENELLGQTNFLFMAGHATTTSALSWTLFLLAQHPAIMADLLDELEEVLHGSAPSVAQLAALPLLEGVIQESLRLFPPVLWWSRICVDSCLFGPYEIPAGARVVYSAYITHRLPDLYPRPNAFLPKRWLTMNPAPYAYVPFSSGPRMCLGGTFAMMEMKVVLAMLLQRYRLSLQPGARVDHGGLMLSIPRPGLPMVVHAQDRQFTHSPVQGIIGALGDLT